MEGENKTSGKAVSQGEVHTERRDGMMSERGRWRTN